MSNEFHDENNLYHFSYRDPNAGSHAESAAGSIVEPAADPVVTNTLSLIHISEPTRRS